jgi:hypothetical protein
LSFDLQSYLERFPQVCKVKFGRAYNFHALEKRFEQLRDGKRWLVAKDVANIFDPAQTPFARYWAMPNEKELDQVLKNARLLLGPLPADPREMVKGTLAALHSIGLVSLVLRFVHPDRFGIFSTPIINLLQIHRARTDELYLAYCEELGEWKDRFRLPSVAETETALWTYHELATEEEKAGDTSGVRSAFDADVWIQRRRVAQALRPFLQKYGSLELARILAEEHPKLAGKIAGEEYERLLRYAAHKLAQGIRLGVKGAIEILFDRLVEDGHISLEEKTLLRKAWEVRCAAVHPGGSLAPEEVEIMIDTVERICRPWESAS